MGVGAAKVMPHYLHGLVQQIEQCGGQIHITIQGEVRGIPASHTGTQRMSGQAVDYLRLVAWGVLGMTDEADGTKLQLTAAPPHTTQKKRDSSL